MRKDRLYKVRNTPEDIRRFMRKFKPEFLTRDPIPVIGRYSITEVSYIGIDCRFSDREQEWKWGGFCFWDYYTIKDYDVISFLQCDFHMKEVDI